MSVAADDPKWLLEIAPETPLADALAKILEHRLERLVHHIPGAVERQHDDPEHLHQLRVWSRRLTAALEIVDASFPDIGLRKVFRWLRKIRQICGQSRDLDVRLEFLAKLRRQQPGDAGLEMVEQFTRNARINCQPRLGKQLPVLEAKIHDRVSLILASLTDEPPVNDETFAQTAHELLREQATRMWKVAAPWLHALNPGEASTTDLHALRITAKQFRYAAELFAPVLPESFRLDLYPQLQELQGMLGDIQDSAASAHTLQRDRRYAEETLVTWFGLSNGPGAEARTLLSGIETTIEAYAAQAASARKSLAECWPGFIGARFGEPLARLGAKIL